MRVGRGIARLVSFVFLAWSLSSGVARADTSTVEGVPGPIVRVQLPGQAHLTIRTWDRPAIQIEGADAGSLIVERQLNRVPAMLPPTLIRLGQIKGPDGPLVLPAESFVVSTLPPGPRNVVLVRAEQGHDVGAVTITIPNDTALLAANVARGSLSLRDYKEGTFILHLHTGTVQLENVGGDGFVQVMRGPLLVGDSNINRLRARTALGNQIFERCRSRQIEATSVNGSIVYDGGSFEPGLARFDSTTGNVAIGVAGPSQLGARAGGSGKIYTMFERRAQVENRDSEASALVEGGGPVITATSGTGNVYLYDGSLHAKTRLPAEWKVATAALRTHAPRPGNTVPATHEPPKERELPPPPKPKVHPPPQPHGRTKFR